jgi:hypothetical protein
MINNIKLNQFLRIFTSLISLGAQIIASSIDFGINLSLRRLSRVIALMRNVLLGHPDPVL